MTPARWRQIKEVLAAALERPEEERGPLLAEACAGDAELRAEVETLLANDRQAENFLDTGARLAVLDAIPDSAGEAAAGARIGPYRIVREIGRGGMGAVYLAERDDQEYRKRVAIKLIRDDLTAAFVLQRFRQERQILAELDHPHIARLLDGGTTAAGVSYFVMEYVQGVAIDAYCEASAPAVDQRLALFRTVCSAVGYAHGKRIVHRDLKPGNILVTAEGSPKLLDFGIAKLLLPQAGSDHTVTGTRLMTPRYASPEQWRSAPVTEASDIYSLGVILYRLLTGRDPYRLDSDRALELGRAICEQDPEPPSSAAPSMRPRLAGDIDAIVLKALRKEPERRYRSVEELSEDVGRHLEGLPVRARRNSLVYRTARLVRRNRAVTMAAATMAVAVGLAIALVYHLPAGTDPSPSPGPLTSMAVLPLSNLSGDPEQQFFADGMTEALIRDLSRIRSLRVIALTSVKRSQRPGKSLQEIARELKVDGVVEGSVVRSGQRVRISAHLIRASDDRQLWAQSYERGLPDVLALQGALAGDIATQIGRHLDSQEQAQLTNRHLTKPAAYLAYVRGRYFWNKRTAQSMKTAITYFEEALKEDPSYALAHSGLADCHSSQGYFFGRVPPREALPMAKAAALKALELDETLAEAHTSLALVKFSYDWDWPGAEREFRRAIELNPNYATAHSIYATFLCVMHRMDESVKEARKALALDPLSLPVNNVLGEVLTCAGRYDEALEQYRKADELDPSFALVADRLGHLYELKGLEREAVEQFLKARTLWGESPVQVQKLRRSFEDGGMRGFRERELQLATAQWDGWHMRAVTIASLHAYLGHRDHAMTWLEKAYQARSGALIWMGLGLQDATKGLRSDPRFQDLLRRIGLPSST